MIRAIFGFSFPTDTLQGAHHNSHPRTLQYIETPCSAKRIRSEVESDESHNFSRRRDISNWKPGNGLWCSDTDKERELVMICSLGGMVIQS